MMLYTRIGSNRGNPQNTIMKCTKQSHSLEWYNSTITIILSNTLCNALVVVTKHNATVIAQ